MSKGTTPASIIHQAKVKSRTPISHTVCSVASTVCRHRPDLVLLISKWMIVHLECKPDDKSHRFVTKATLSSGWRVASLFYACSKSRLRGFKNFLYKDLRKSGQDSSRPQCLKRENEGKTSDWSAATWLAVGSRRVCCMNNRGGSSDPFMIDTSHELKISWEITFPHTEADRVEVWRSGVDLHPLYPWVCPSSSNTSRVRGSGYGNPVTSVLSGLQTANKAGLSRPYAVARQSCVHFI